jgi:HEAT repeat protein
MNAAPILALASLLASGQPQARFDDVVRNLRNPDPKTRLTAVHLLRDAKYPEAIGPIAPLVMDSLDDIQIEAIAAELSFFIDQDVRTKKMIGFVIEKRRSGIAPSAFDLGPLAVWPRAVPAELVDALLQAIDDDNPKVRLEAIYAFGIIARRPLTIEQLARLIKALDHYDPAIRSGAARVIERQKFQGTGDALIKAVNDSQADVRYASMRALGAIGEERAVGALSEQLAYYKKGEGAWSALHALALIPAPASVPIFKERLRDKDPFLRRAAAEGLGRSGDTSETAALEQMVTSDESAMVRVAAAFALQKLGQSYAARIVDLMSTAKLIPQAQEYLIELGAPMVTIITPRLQEPDPDVREAIAEVLGAIGDPSSLAPLETATKDREETVAAAATRAMAQIKAR